MSIIIGIDHGYYAIKTAHCSFPAGLTSYGEHEPYTRQGLLEFGGCFFVCGSGRQPIQRDKTVPQYQPSVSAGRSTATQTEISGKIQKGKCTLKNSGVIPFGNREYLNPYHLPFLYRWDSGE